MVHQQTLEGLGPWRLGSLPAPSRPASTQGSPSPVPQTWPGYRMSISLSPSLAALGDRPAGDPSNLPSLLIPLDDHAHSRPKAVAINGETMWEATGGKGLCLVTTINTSVQRICERKQAVPVSRGGRS